MVSLHYCHESCLKEIYFNNTIKTSQRDGRINSYKANTNNALSRNHLKCVSFHKWDELRFPRKTNTASCGVKYLRKNGTAARRIEEIHIIAEGESQLNLRTHPSFRASAKRLYQSLQFTSWIQQRDQEVEKRVKGGILQQK